MAFDAEQGRRSRLTDLVIPNGTQASNFISSSIYAQFHDIAILPPATLPETVNPQFNNDPSLDETADAQWTTYLPLDPKDADLDFVAGVGILLPAPPTHGFRVKSTANVAAERTFKVWGIRRPS